MVSLRKANYDDEALLFEWANDPIVRDNSFNSNFISYEEHEKWFNHIMNSESIYQYILVDDDTPIGQVRLNVHGTEAEIGYSIAKEFRGQGYGHVILRLLLTEVRNNHHEIKTLISMVKPNNDASNALFIREGYSIKYLCYSFDVQKEYNK